MIGRLTGLLVYRGADHVMLDVGRVGYIVTCADRTLASLPPPGATVSLYTDMLVREDLLQLMGFATLAEKEWYRLLVSVQGVGAKAALAILSALGPDGTGRAIALGDAGAIRAAQGVGPKLAQRVVNELKDKAASVLAIPAPVTPASVVVGDTAEPVAAPGPGDGAAQSDAISALVNLGYGTSEAAQAVAQAVRETPEAETPALIRAGLRALAPKG